MAGAIEEAELVVDGIRVFYRRVLGDGTRRSMALTMRQARGDRSPMPPEFVEMVWRHWDKGTSRAVLTLYRDADPDRLAAAGKDFGKLTCWSSGATATPTYRPDSPRLTWPSCPIRSSRSSKAPATGPGSTTQLSRTG
jgi:hypothetical protein